MKKNSIRKMILNILDKEQITKKKLAERLGVSPAQITRWMNNAEPKLSNLQKLKAIYNKIAV